MDSEATGLKPMRSVCKLIRTGPRRRETILATLVRQRARGSRLRRGIQKENHYSRHRRVGGIDGDAPHDLPGGDARGRAA
jgi:hypothetical protein